jgi:signal transduction histidine kinase/DNA-binding NarL/FixJ family response regulator
VKAGRRSARRAPGVDQSQGQPDAYDLSPVALLTLSRAGIVRAMNLAAAALLQVSRDELLGRPLSPFIAPGSRASFLRLVGSGRPAGASVSGAVTLLRANGRQVEVRLLVRVAGDGRAFLALFEGESQRRVAAARRVAAMERDTRETGEARERFIAMLGHELRAPLTPLIFATHVLERRDWKPDDLRRWADLVRRSVAAEVRLIDDLLDATRISRNKMTIEPHPTDLHAEVAAALETIGPTIAQKAIRMDVDLSAPIRRVNGDPLRLRQVFWNLISNAVKFTPSGGAIAVRSWLSGTSIAVEVSDSGIGLDGAARERIFTPFEQMRPGAGLGLGLAIAKGIVDLHGGRITVASPGKNKGTRFVVELPALAADVPEVAPPRPSAPPVSASGEGVRILLVDDDDDILQSLCELLELAGCRVTAAGSPAAALAIDLGRIDVVVADIGLPGMTGWDLIRKLRRRRSDLPAVAMSGYGTENDRRASRDAGFDAHLTKPVDVNELIATIRALTAAADRHETAPAAVAPATAHSTAAAPSADSAADRRDVQTPQGAEAGPDAARRAETSHARSARG